MAADGHSPFNQSSSVKSRILRGALKVNSYDLEPGKPPIVVARINTVASQGVEVLEVDVQVQIASGVPAFTVAGLPDKAMAESRERVRAALGAIGLSLPPKRITVNLSPADVLKEGSHFDLPIAVGLLVSMGVIGAEDVAGFFVLGELALDGSLAAVSGVLPAALGPRPGIWA